jgi:dihydroorotase
MSDQWVAGSRMFHNVDEPHGPEAAPGDPNTKVNPPLRTLNDTSALLDALKRGDFDIIATDHAPHAEVEKSGSDFEHAAFGLSGLEFALPTCMALVRAGHLSMTDVIFRLANEPGRLLGKGTGTLVPGASADIVIFDPDQEWTVVPSALKTKSHNTPMLGMTLRGHAVKTIVAGEVRFDG